MEDDVSDSSSERRENSAIDRHQLGDFLIPYRRALGADRADNVFDAIFELRDPGRCSALLLFGLFKERILSFPLQQLGPESSGIVQYQPPPSSRPSGRCDGEQDGMQRGHIGRQVLCAVRGRRECQWLQ